jgi:putative ABC transport system permease protein
MRNRLEAFKSALRESPGVVNVSVSGNLPGGSDYGIPWAPEGVAEGQIPPVRSLVVDHDFIKTYGMGIAAGRDFSAAFATDTAAWLINEEAARVLGWDNPLGKSIAMPAVGRGKAPVVGVVKDFNFHSLHEPVGALLFFIPPKEWMSYVSVRIRPENVSESLAFMEKKWNDFDPNHPFVYEFLDVAFGQMYMQEKRTASLANAMSLLAIFIACLGLFGLAAHAAEQRKKEIGVRKVLGASTAGLVGLLSKDFLKLVVVALVIASPLAYFFMERWLQDFAYRIDIQWTVFALAGIVAVAVAFLTVSFQSVKAALDNPVKSLRSE